jgi:hypothetical protein
VAASKTETDIKCVAGMAAITQTSATTVAITEGTTTMLYEIADTMAKSRHIPPVGNSHRLAQTMTAAHQ